MSVAISIRGAVKRFGGVTVIPGISAEIEDGEFFTLLGPSGCGKTTLLRMIAGFNSIEGGTVSFNGNVVNDLDPGKRNIGMVFQNYAVFPHMSVAKNIAFGLENRRVPKDEIARRVDEIMRVVQIEAFRDRLPSQLSGGQQQRVALARAIVINPDVLLMDEPLSNLDAKLRVEMRNAIKEIQNKVHITTIYVTHDQEEAMAVSDRIAVLKGGEIQHVGRPQAIYQRPANLFVSTFIGRTNVFECELEGDALTLCGSVFKLTELDAGRLPPGRARVRASIRPEEFFITDGDGVRAVIDDSIFLGLNTHYFASLADGSRVEIVQESTIEEILKPGAEICLGVKQQKINVFDESGGLSLMKGVLGGDAG